MNMIDKKTSTLLIGLFLPGLAVAQNNPDWPWLYGSDVIGTPHRIVDFLRLYPTSATAFRNPVLHRPSSGPVPLDEKHDDFDILTGFTTENTSGVFNLTVFISGPIVDDQPLSIVVPLWFPDEIVDRDDFKLRGAAGVAPNI